MSAAQNDGADAFETHDEPAPIQLSGDARLQFWRDVYLAALPPLLATLPPGNAGTFSVLGVTRLACDAADAALAQHLARNVRGELDSLVESLLADPKSTGSL